ncbi:MAG: aminotransferase class III-fold pyridoxal phosphate-dependent enzyme [Candidatus Heimdallarchaeota archaeon]|nr:aminotransferase class III-fold pyridoxal phosphate-dependent enzyme [Candidatus Heimdallarchaeota archaeon]MCK4954088.1 aminotransferase class III-fold pyridoxal phosphate-dependent enzyme [Candidatus Heimdallarchaeota archaeon]
MTVGEIEKVKADIIEKYKNKTSTSEKHFEEAKKWLPGGGTRNVAYFYPYPFFVTKGEGCYLYDYDGNQYIDCLNSMTVNIHGHAHPKIVEKMQEQAKEGTSHAAPMELQYELAKIICDRTPSIELLRFCNSGTEATMFTIRAAREYTKKNKIIKTEGGYHGSHDYVEVNITPNLTAEEMPIATVEKGVPETVLQDVYIVPYNDLSAAEKIMKKHHKKIAAMIIEPIMGSGGGAIATKEYLQGLRDLTKKYGILLIFDEVITFRMTTGGMQKYYGVTPDLTALGKTIGGGLPVGAFGGKREIIDQFNPTKKKFITHSGTFSGNAMTMIAGKTAMELYDEAEIERLGRLGDRLKEGLREVLKNLNIKGQVSGLQSLIYVYLFEEPIINARQTVFKLIPTLELSKYLTLTLAINGIYAVSRGVTAFILSTPMNEEIIDEIVVRYRRAMEMILPLYNQIKNYSGFASIIFAMLKSLNTEPEFSKQFKEHNYTILLVAKEDPKAIKLLINKGEIQFNQLDNQSEIIKAAKKECDASIITTTPIFLGFGSGQISPIKAILFGKLRIKGLKYILKFSKYFKLLQ